MKVAKEFVDMDFPKKELQLFQGLNSGKKGGNFSIPMTIKKKKEVMRRPHSGKWGMGCYQYGCPRHIKWLWNVGSQSLVGRLWLAETGRKEKLVVSL